METTVKNVLEKHDFIVATLDNNQKGFPKTFQRYGVSNKFVKVTASFFKLYCPIPTTTPHPESTVNITYVNQPIPSPYGMSSYESLVSYID